MSARSWLTAPRGTLLALGMAIGGVASAAPPSPAALAEIAHLLSHLEASRCAFLRNGTWHDSRDARAHLQKKLDYMMKRSLVGSAEDFIARAATASSVSGAEYQVRCQPAPAVPSSEWLRDELRRFRAAHGGIGKAAGP